MPVLKNISIGIYYPGNSLLHRLQARTKLLVLFWLVLFFFVANHRQWHFIPYIVAGILVLISVALAGISLKYIWQRMRLLVLVAFIGAIPTALFGSERGTPFRTFGPVLLSYAALRSIIVVYSFLLVIFILLFVLPIPALRNIRQHGWFRRIRILLIFITLIVVGFLWLTRNAASTSILPIGPIMLTYDGVWLVITIFAVFLVLYAFSLLLTMTTTPVALIEGLMLLLSPLRRLKLPVDDFALMTLIALRFIPTLIDEVDQLTKAQTSRGADFSHGTLRERLQSLSALFVPFIHGTLRRAAELATALEARGYEVDGRQTFLHETSFSAADYVVMGTVVLVTIGAIVLF